MRHLSAPPAPRALPLLLALVAGVPATGCLAYNDECQALVDNPQEVIGNLDEEVYIDKPNARHANNAIGQMAADAFMHSQDDSPAPAVFGAINGGGIRAEGVCITRNALLPGPLKKGVLHEVLPFDNLVVAVDLTRDELRRVMEASASGLYRTGQPITVPPGSFLQIAGATMEVDCSKPGGTGCVVGSTCRVLRMNVGGRDVLSGDPNEKFRVALTRFVINSAAGISDIIGGLDSDLSRNPVQTTLAGGIDSNLAELYMRQHYDRRNGQPGLKVDPTRIVFDNCAIPLPPGQ